MSGDNGAYYVSTGELGMHTYDTVQMSDAKAKNSTTERRLVGSHTNPVSKPLHIIFPLCSPPLY